MKGNRKLLRPQDILIASKVLVLGEKTWTQMEVAHSLGLSQTEVAFGLDRLRSHHLLDSEKRKILPGAFLEFLVHGLKYVFPAEIGSIKRGMPTGAGTRPLNQKIRLSSENILVWPTDEGTIRGQSLVPIYETVTFAAKVDSKLYELLSLIDAIRAGGVRERELATQILSFRIQGKIKSA